MLKQTVMIVAAASLLTVAVVAQNRPTPTPPGPAEQTAPAPRPAQPATPREQPPREPQPAPARQPEPAGQPVNVKLEVTITDQAGPGEPTRKIVTMIVADRAGGSVRSNGIQNVAGMGTQPVSINVDATPNILRDGAIRLQFGLEYQPRPALDPQQTTAPTGRMSQINERLAVILQEGKPLIISQAADPGSDRKITVELRATVLK
jgi:hypothetical protein